MTENQWGQTRLIYRSSRPSFRTCSGIQSNYVRPAGDHISLDTGFRWYDEAREKSIESDPIDFPRLTYRSSGPLCRTCSGIQSNNVRPAGDHISLDTGFRRYDEAREKSIESDPIDSGDGHD